MRHGIISGDVIIAISSLRHIMAAGCYVMIVTNTKDIQVTRNSHLTDYGELKEIVIASSDKRMQVRFMELKKKKHESNVVINEFR